MICLNTTASIWQLLNLLGSSDLIILRRYVLRHLIKPYCLTLILLSLAVSGVCFAAPEITSSPADVPSGSSVTINGRGFGTKAKATPIIWDNFESGTPGAVPSTPVIGSNWVSSHSGSPVQYSSSVLRAGSRSARADFRTSSNYRSSIGVNGGNWGSLYVTLWYRSDYSSLSAYNGDPTRNQKIFRIEGNNGTKSGDQQEGVPLIAYEKLSPDNFFTSTRAQYTPTTYAKNIYSSGPGWANQQWNRVEIYANVIDGQKEFTIYEGGRNTTPSKSSEWWTGTWLPHMGEDSSRFNEVFFGFYFARDNGAGAYVYLDDIYVDTTQARVEIGNASSWSSCTHREIQVPTSWSDGSIRVTVNRGTFNVGERAYLFVVDASGAASGGYPVTIASGSGSTPSTVDEPNNLKVLSSTPN